jgi:methionyl-tRNA formyltransferase
MTRAIVFAYSEVGLRCLQVLNAIGVQVPLLFTHEDDPAEKRWFGSVSEFAARHGIRTVMPADPNTPQWLAAARELAPDFVLSFYYRHMLNREWLEIPSRGALNVHGSLLPAYRGRAPVHWAIINGETCTGATLHHMVNKPDAGEIVDREAFGIGADEDALSVSKKLAIAAEIVVARAMPKLIAGTAVSTPMDLSRGSYFGRRRPEDGRIDWTQAAQRIHNLVRAVAAPFPGAFTDVNGSRLAVHETRLDAGAPLHAARAPCLYAHDGAWYADCVDGHRLNIRKAVLAGVALDARRPPPQWSLPLSLD